jgi:exopolyphosphatase/guanosine-5'-triphosphate,3'-diphosphate pyrophosphatase
LRSASLVPPTATRTRRLAAIDIGSNSIRLMVAEAAPDGEYRILDDEKRTTRLAHGLAESGELSDAAIEQSFQALQHMKAICEGYGVERVGVIATSAVREARNGSHFVTMVRERLGLNLEVISAQEEGELSFRSVERHFDLKNANAVVVDLGGGSAELIFAANGIVEEIFSLPLGSVRLTESLIQSDPLSEQDYRRLRKHIRRCFKEQVGKPEVWPHIMIGAGGTFMALANISMRMRGEPYSALGGYELTRSEVRHILDYLRQLPLRGRRAVPGLNADRADIIVAGLVVIERLMKLLEVNRLQVHDRGIRDGLLLGLMQQAFGFGTGPSEDKDDPLSGVRQFMAICGFEQRHSQHVTSLALQIFDQLQEALHLPPQERLLLEAAALLHEVGYLINYEKHHQHSYHLIIHGNIRGLSPKQRELVANVARYHRRSEPKLKHENFARLLASERETVRRLSAILRLADGLDRTHMQRIQSLACRKNGTTVSLTVTADKMPDVDLWGSQEKGKLFENVFGVKLKLLYAGASAAS